MTTECARLMNAMAQGMKEVQSRSDPNAQLFVRALSTCGQFMTSLSIEMQRRMQKVEGFRSLPLDLPYEGMLFFRTNLYFIEFIRTQSLIRKALGWC